MAKSSVAGSARQLVVESERTTARGRRRIASHFWSWPCAAKRTRCYLPVGHGVVGMTLSHELAADLVTLLRKLCACVTPAGDIALRGDSDAVERAEEAALNGMQ